MPGRRVHFAGLKTSGTCKRDIRNWDCALKGHTHAFLLLGTRQRKQIETEWGSGRFPMTVPTCTHPQYTLTSAPLALVQLPTRAKDVIAEECTLVGGSEPAQIWHCTWMGCGHSLLVFAEMVDWKMSGALTLMPEPFQCMSQPTPGTHSCPSCFNAVPLRGKGVVGMGEYAHLVRMEPARTRTSGVLLQPFGTNRCSW